MFCVIQKIVNKKTDTNGAYKELKVTSVPVTNMFGQTRQKYGYEFGTERFERPIKEAYKITIHKSYREDGKVKKKQWYITTISYYDLIEYPLEDCYNSRLLQPKLDEMGITEKQMLDMIYDKLDPYIIKAQQEFRKSDEGKTKRKHDRILEEYRTKKSKFDRIHREGEYDFCYDIYGELRNPSYLEILESVKEKYKSSYEKSSQSNYNNYSNYDYSSYFKTSSSNYSENEKIMLKKIYKVAAKKFHPDVANDDGSMMKFLTKLKEQWGI